MDVEREDHVLWFATESDRDKAARYLPYRSKFGSVHATVDAEVLTSGEIEELLDDFCIDAMLVHEPQMRHSPSP